MTSEQFQQFGILLFTIILTFVFTGIQIGIVYDEVKEIKTLMKGENDERSTTKRLPEGCDRAD